MMPQNIEILIDGSYSFKKNDVSYCEENFKLVSFKDNQNIHLYSECLARIETGEFLKILVRYEMNSSYIPHLVRIEKTLGNKYSQEVYEINGSAGELQYTFQNTEKSQEFKRSFNTRHCIVTPAFCTSAIFSYAKKFEPGLRVPVTMISTDNIWSYDGPPKEKVVYIELKVKDRSDFIAEKLPADSSLFNIYENPSPSAVLDPPVELGVSKDYSIPYQMSQFDKKITLQKFKTKDQT